MSLNLLQELSMKPYLAEYLRERDLHEFRSILKMFTSPQKGDCRRVVLRCIEMALPNIQHQVPSLTEREMLIMAIDEVAGLDLPAELP
jgi:hypothetical protein